MLTGLWVTGVLAAVAAGLLGLRRRYVVVRVSGQSMAPTLRHGDRVLVRRRSGYRVRPGEIVVLEGPPLDGLPLPTRGRPVPPLGTLVKRVVAVAGDLVPPGIDVTGDAGRVPAGKLVVIGDNMAASVDSRALGFFAAAEVTGIVVRHLR